MSIALTNRVIALEAMNATLLDRLSALEGAVFNPIEIEVKKGPGGKWFVYADDEICGAGYDSEESAVEAAAAMAGSAASA